MGLSENQLLAYIYDSSGDSCEGIILKKDPAQIAGFVAASIRAGKIEIYDYNMNLFLDTVYGGFVNKCSDQQLFADEILPKLLEHQLREKPIPELSLDFSKWVEEGIQLEEKEIKNYIREAFNVSL